MIIAIQALIRIDGRTRCWPTSRSAMRGAWAVRCGLAGFSTLVVAPLSCANAGPAEWLRCRVRPAHARSDHSDAARRQRSCSLTPGGATRGRNLLYRFEVRRHRQGRRADDDGASQPGRPAGRSRATNARRAGAHHRHLRAPTSRSSCARSAQLVRAGRFTGIVSIHDDDLARRSPRERLFGNAARATTTSCSRRRAAQVAATGANAADGTWSHSRLWTRFRWQGRATVTRCRRTPRVDRLTLATGYRSNSAAAARPSCAAATTGPAARAGLDRWTLSRRAELITAPKAGNACAGRRADAQFEDAASVRD